MITENFYEKFKEAMLDENYDNVYIIAHSNPDGDAVGSSCALAHLLRRFGKHSKAFFSDLNTPESKFDYIADKNEEFDDFDVEHIITTDVTDSYRLSGVPVGCEEYTDFLDKLDFVIDHHEQNTIECGNMLVLPEKSSCGEIIYDLYKMFGQPFDDYSARALYTAIATDTGCFRYNNTTPSTFLAAAELMPAVEDNFLPEIINRNFETKPKKKLNIESYAALHARYYFDDEFVFSVFDTKTREELDATPDMFDGISGMLRQVEGVKAAFLLRQEKSGNYKVSVRSRFNGVTGVDCSALCESFGGGGHKAAAGCIMKDDAETCIKLLLRAARKYEIK